MKKMKSLCKCGNNNLEMFDIKSNIKLLSKTHLSDIATETRNDKIIRVSYDFSLGSNHVEIVPTNLVCLECEAVLSKKRSIEILDLFPVAHNVFKS